MGLNHRLENGNVIVDSMTPAQAYCLASDKKFIWFCAGRGCFAKGTQVQLFNGWSKPVEEIEVGDVVLGDDLTPRNVVRTLRGYERMYRVSGVESKLSYDCNEGHRNLVVDKFTGLLVEMEVPELLMEPSRYLYAAHPNATNYPLSTLKIEFLGWGQFYGFELDGNHRFLLENGSIALNSGKTHLGARWLYSKCVRFPRARGIVAANTYGQLHSATLPPALEYFRSIGLKYTVNKRPPDKWLERTGFEAADYKNILVVETGTHLFLRSLDKPEAIRGVELGFGWIDEIASSTKVAWDIIIGALRDKNCSERQILVTGTPDGEQNWTWSEFKKKWSLDPKIANAYDIVFMSSRENPHLPIDFLDDMLSSYDPRRALQEVDGRILADQDANIYHEWRPSVHNKLVAPYDPTEPLILCWDFNASKESPMSMEICQQHYYRNGTPFIQVLDEVIIPAGNTPKVCEEFIRRYASKHQSDIYVYGDATGNNRAATVGVSDYAMIKEYFQNRFKSVIFRVPKKNMAERDRRAAVNAMMLNARGEVRMFVADQCVELMKDFDTLQPDKHGKINKAADLARSHASDALGYYIAREFPVKTLNENKISGVDGEDLNFGYR